MSQLMVSKVGSITIPIGESVSDTYKGGESIADAEFLIIHAPLSASRGGTGLDASLVYLIECSPNIAETETGTGNNTTTNPFRTLVSTSGVDVELPAEDKCKVYDLPVWPSFRFAIRDSSGAYDQAGWDTTFDVYKAWRV